MDCSDVNREIKSRLPIPLFTGDTVLTFKSVSNKNYKQGKKLLFAANSLQERDLSKEEKQKEDSLIDSCEKEYLLKDKFSLSEKLTEIYLESAKKKTARNGCFIKCNYLEELVVQEDLSYFIMKIYPSKIFLYYKNPYRVNFFYHAKIDEEYDLFDSIDNEEIPTYIFGQIMSCENWFLMYDYHCFLQIQKYAFEDECAQPVFSDFVLLKPTIKFLIDLFNKSAYDSNNNNGNSHEELKENYESKIYVEISGPLYLDVHPAALELINLLKIYQSPFGSTSLKMALAKRPVSVNKQSFKVNPFKEELLKMLEEKIPHPSCSSEGKVLHLNGSPFSYVDLKEDLHSNLVNRNLEISGALYTSRTTTLVEVFELITSKKAFTTNGHQRSLENYIKYLSVFWKYGRFYSCLTLDKYIYDPNDPNDFISLLGGREDLDRYILKVAEILSCRFTKFLSIQYKNMIDNTDKHFFPPFLDTKMNYEPDERNFVKSRINGTKKKGVSSMKERSCTDETERKSDDEFDFLAKHNLVAQTDYAIKCKCSFQIENPQKTVPHDMETSDDKEEEINSDVDNWGTDILNSRLFRNIFSNTVESRETPDIQGSTESFLPGSCIFDSDSVMSVFETQPFEEEKSNDCDSVSEISCGSLESYPSLKSKFEVSKEDFMKDIIHDHSDDMKKLLKLIQGCEDYL